MEWIIETIGTEIISIIVGIIFGSGITYKIMYNKYVKTTVVNQKQKARDNSNQNQIGVFNGRK